MATGKRGGRGIKDRNLSQTAGIRPYKLDLVYSSEANFLTAKGGGEGTGTAEEGDWFYDSTTNSIKVHNGTQWEEYLVASSLTGDVSVTAAGATTVTDLTMTGEATNEILEFDGTNWVSVAVSGAVTQTGGAFSLNTNLSKGILHFPIGSFAEQDGTALADFADGASPTPGISAGDESFGIRWNNHANPDPVSCSVIIPPDIDTSANATMYILAAKVGATVGDAVTWLVQLFNNVDAALYDADTDYGGTSSAMTGDAATKTCQLESLTITAADLPASQGVMVMTIQPTDGTLGTDDVILLGCWIEYTRVNS